MRSAVLTLGSLALTTAVVANAYYQKKQFYPSVVYITKSNPSMAIMYLQALVMVILTGEIMRKIFFGQLRTAELEHLIDRSWYVVTETCLAFTIFRDDFSPKFVALFTLLLFLKCFHWLADDRVDYMERSPVISALFHIRVVSLLIVLGALDSVFVHLAYQSMVTKGASVQLVFGFEYAILLTVVVNIFIKYVLHTVDLQSENPWENKAVFLLYTELAIGLVKLLLYMLFVCIMMKIHTFPLFAIRPMYLTMRAFKKAFNDVIMSRRAIRNMNTLYPDATAEELATLDNVCIICREEMVTASCKKLPCNHIFHTSCLRSWFQRQQTCPTCRMDVLRLPQAAAAAAAARGRPNIAELIRAAAAAARQDQTPQPAPAAVPPQQQQPANVPRFFPNMMPGPFPMWPMMPPGFAPPANPQPNAENAATGNSTFSASNEGTNQTASSATASGGEQGSRTNSSQVPLSFGPGPLPPMFMPPFFFPPPIPPPIPPPGFGAMSDEELRRMEGSQRQHVEARVQCLRNIQTFLDAAVMQMEQYTAIVASLNFNTGAADIAGPSAESTNGGRPKEPSPSTNTQTSTNDARRKEEDGAKASNGDVPQMRSGGGRLTDEDDGEPLDEREALRKRRLQKFSETSTTPKEGGSD